MINPLQNILDQVTTQTASPAPKTHGSRKHQNPFTMADQNGDGYVDSSELASFLDVLSKQTQKTVDSGEVFSALDVNSDGKIDPTEFQDGREKVTQMLGLPNLPPPPPENPSETQTLLQLLAARQTDPGSTATPSDTGLTASQLQVYLLDYIKANGLASNPKNVGNSLLDVMT
jgi:hypothetical protein